MKRHGMAEDKNLNAVSILALIYKLKKEGEVGLVLTFPSRI